MSEKFQKVTLNIHQGDKEILEKFYPNMGWSVAARALLHKMCKKLQEKEARTATNVGLTIDTSDLR